MTPDGHQLKPGSIPPPSQTGQGDTTETRPWDTSAGPARRPTPLAGRFGRYDILRQLGQGGMGAVYLAHDSQLDRQVALKVPHFSPADGPEALERFHREARAAATIEHPNICPVYDVGEIDGIHYLTMAFVAGQSLADLLKAGPLPQRQAAELTHQLCLALAEAHARNIVHRDLKPSNVMLNARGEPVIMDFGLARELSRGGERLTLLGAIVGTPAYMAPEQVAGEVDAHGPATDVYSLGAMLYEMLTGRLPFSGSVAKVLGQILEKEPVKPSTLCAALDPALEAAVLKAMSKNPADRYRSMSDFASALNSYLKPTWPRADGHEGEGDDQATAVRKTRIMPRQRSGPRVGLWVALGVISLLLLAGGGVGVWLIIELGNQPAPSPVSAGSSPAPAEKPKPTLPRGWLTFSPPEGGFSVALPGQPQVQKTPIHVRTINKDLNQYIIREGQTIYTVGFVEFPGQVFTEKDLDACSEKFSEGFMKSMTNARLLQQKRIELDGYPGLEAEIDGEFKQKPVRLLSRFYLVRQRMVLIMAMVPAAEHPSEKVKAFFESFQVTP